jgi:hypothetical protein
VGWWNGFGGRLIFAGWKFSRLQRGRPRPHASPNLENILAYYLSGREMSFLIKKEKDS